jgi:hypothetical protein
MGSAALVAGLLPLVARPQAAALRGMHGPSLAREALVLQTCFCAAGQSV